MIKTVSKIMNTFPAFLNIQKASGNVFYDILLTTFASVRCSSNTSLTKVLTYERVIMFLSCPMHITYPKLLMVFLNIHHFLILLKTLNCVIFA